MSPDHTPYVAVLDTAEIQPTMLSVQLLNRQNNVRLLLELTGLDGGMLRVKVREHSPIRQRYEPPIGDVLVAEPVHKK